MSDSDFNEKDEKQEVTNENKGNNDGSFNIKIEPKHLILIQSVIIAVLIAVIALFPIINGLGDSEDSESTVNNQQERVVKPQKHLTKKQLRKIRRAKKRQIRKAKKLRKKQIRAAKKVQKQQARAVKKKQRQQRRAAKKAGKK